MPAANSPHPVIPRPSSQFIKSGFTGLLPRPFDASQVRNRRRRVAWGSWAATPFGAGACLCAHESGSAAAAAGAQRTHLPALACLPVCPHLVQGGTRAAPPHFNDRNREEPANYWADAARCAYVATLRDPSTGELIDTLGEPSALCAGRAALRCWAGAAIADCAPRLPPAPPTHPPTAGEDESAWETVAALPFVDQARSPPLTRAFWLPRLSAARNRRMEYVLLRRRGDVKDASGQRARRWRLAA